MTRIINTTLVLIALISSAYSADEKLTKFLDQYEVVFTARYVQAGLKKRYLIEDIYKGKLTQNHIDAMKFYREDESADNVEYRMLFMIDRRNGLKTCSTRISKNAEVMFLIDDQQVHTNLNALKTMLNCSEIQK